MIASPALIETPAVVIGAGPVGLFQVFQLGLQDIRAHVVDALPHPGGQCAELYPDKPLYDIPGIVQCTGAELIANLMAQIAPLHPQFHWNQLVTGLHADAEGRWNLETSAGVTLRTSVVCIAAGAGAFQPRKLNLPGAESLQTGTVFYHPSDPQAHAGKNVVIVGDTEQALEWALRLGQPGHDGVPIAHRVTVLHRRDVFKCEASTEAAFRAAVQAGTVQLCIAQATALEATLGRLTGLHVTDADARTDQLPVDHLLVLQGLSPKLGPIADWGLALERKQISVAPHDYSTELPGIYAVGDINTYPGKRKLILCGFHEATLAAFSAAARVFPDKAIQLQYTTTSSHLHGVLGKTPKKHAII